MSSGTWNREIESPVAAARLFKAVVVDWHNLAPKLMPEIVASATAEALEGGVGSTRQLNFTAAMPFPCFKERLDFIDEENLESKGSLVEGGDLGIKLESASSRHKFEATSNGGCIVKLEASYKTLPGVAVDDEVGKAQEQMVGVIKAAEAYLLANPTAYA